MCVTQISPLIQSHPNNGIIYVCAFLLEYVRNSAYNYKYKMPFFAVYKYKTNEMHVYVIKLY